MQTCYQYKSLFNSNPHEAGLRPRSQEQRRALIGDAGGAGVLLINTPASCQAPRGVAPPATDLRSPGTPSVRQDEHSLDFSRKWEGSVLRHYERDPLATFVLSFFPFPPSFDIEISVSRAAGSRPQRRHGEVLCSHPAPLPLPRTPNDSSPTLAPVQVARRAETKPYEVELKTYVAPMVSSAIHSHWWPRLVTRSHLQSPKATFGRAL